MPMMVSMYFFLHPEGKGDLTDSRFANVFVLVNFLLAAFLTLMGFGFLLATLWPELGIAFPIWCVLHPICLFYVLHKTGSLRDD